MVAVEELVEIHRTRIAIFVQQILITDSWNLLFNQDWLARRATTEGKSHKVLQFAKIHPGEMAKVAL